MAKKTDEEHLENPINNQPESPPDKITPTADTKTIVPNQDIENMEVHHHAHDPAVPHHKKNWKSYFSAQVLETRTWAEDHYHRNLQYNLRNTI
ncbi:MAG: hypothetical protein V9E90_13200 [Saprospiraceae bacterium]|jgi:hypothetical protein